MAEPAAQTEPTASQEPPAEAYRRGPLTFTFCGEPESFTPIYEEKPVNNTASTNAGDYRLYVGGGSINKAFRQLLDIPDKENGYTELHTTMLAKAWASPGTTVTVESEQETKELGTAGLIACCARVSGHNSKAGDATGVAYVDVFKPDGRPLDQKNVGMLYVVGPMGEGASGPKAVPKIAKCADFLAAIQDVGSNAMEAVFSYNELAAKRDDLPIIETVQYCLVSGGAYRHPDCKKTDVAEASCKGMIAAAEKNPNATPLTVKFGYDEGAFEAAVASLWK